MGLCNISLTLVSLMVLAVFHTSYAQNFLNAHNFARRQVNVGPMEWDNVLASIASTYAQRRKVDCNGASSGKPYGENIAVVSNRLSVLNMWAGESRNYDYDSNSCKGGECKHYTQMVWRNSVHLGCASAQCNNGLWFVICYYNPKGNYVGRHPY